jgi:hypothetical protein
LSVLCPFGALGLIKNCWHRHFVDKFIYTFKIFILMSFSFLDYLILLNVLLYCVRSFLMWSCYYLTCPIVISLQL